MNMRVRLAELQRPDGVLPEELRPHVLPERHVLELPEDAFERQSERVVAGVDDLVRATRIRELDDLLRVELGRERAGAVVQIRPLQQQLDRQVRPRLAAVAQDEAQLREEPADL